MPSNFSKLQPAHCLIPARSPLIFLNLIPKSINSTRKSIEGYGDFISMSQTLLQYETVMDISRRFQVRKGTMREILGIS